MELSYLDTDTAMAANSDVKVPSQKAVKSYIDNVGGANASTTVRGIVEEATQAEVDAGTAIGATGARLFINPSTQPSTIPTVRTYKYSSVGDSTTQFDITNPAGTTFRYTWDSTGTDPVINTATFPTNGKVSINIVNTNEANNGNFTITGSGSNYFEITNASGVAENNKTVGVNGFLYVFDGTSWTKPTGLKYVIAEVQAGGGGGGGETADNSARGGGGGGGYSRKLIASSSLGSTETVTIGRGGKRGLNTGADGASGETSSFGSLISATGGSSCSSTTGGIGGVGSSGDINIYGDEGGYAQSGSYTGTENALFGGEGGGSFLGAKTQQNDTGEGTKGYLYGGGGSGAKAPNGGGNTYGGWGAPGIVIVTEYYHV